MRVFSPINTTVIVGPPLRICQDGIVGRQGRRLASCPHGERCPTSPNRRLCIGHSGAGGEADAMAERLPDRAFLKQREAVTDARSSKERVARQARRMPRLILYRPVAFCILGQPVVREAYSTLHSLHALRPNVAILTAG